jgi:O-antigen ligase
VARSYLQADRLIYPLLLISICSLVLKGELLPPKLEICRTIILAIGLFLTFQRNYWITFLLMFALLGLLIRWSGKIKLFSLIILAISILWVVLILPIKPLDRYIAAASDRLIWGMQPQTLMQDKSTQDRIMETNYAVQSILDHPILGIGLGNFYRPAVRSDTYIGGFGNRWYIHNAYLWVLIDMGLVGFIPFILLYAIALARGFKYWKRIPDRKLSVILLGGTLGILGQAISNIVAPNFVQSWMLFIFVVIMGINELIIHWEINPNQVLEQN